MLKVVGASWLQTRISTYILVAVALLGIGAVILGEFGRIENDGTYSATVWWKRRAGYRIDFWGQGNDLKSLPLGAARAYYKTGILENGWSIVEIETSPEYPDDVQAFAAGLLEGSLTWQLIHHHWYNTVRAACAPRASLCRKMRRYVRENADNARENAALLRFEDPYWHMVHLYYIQLDGLAEGWRFAVQRSRQDAEIDPEDFLWLAMAADLTELEVANNGSDHHIDSEGLMVLKALTGNPHPDPLMVLTHNTAAPYARMLRLIKRYKFSYRISPDTNSAQVPGHSITMTSYPGALSSQDETYIISGADTDLFIAGTPLINSSQNRKNRLQTKDRVMSAGRIMAANRLAKNGLSWSRLLDRQNSGTSRRQWIGVEPRTGAVSFIEQIPGFTQHVDRTEEFRTTGFLSCTGVPYTPTIRKLMDIKGNYQDTRAEKLIQLQTNITNIQEIRNLVSGDIGALKGEKSESSTLAPSTTNNDAKLITGQSTNQLLAYRGDLAAIPRPVGVIDSKLLLFGVDGLQSFEVRAGPARRVDAPAFNWAKNFPNSSHLGQPETFAFEGVVPQWIWA